MDDRVTGAVDVELVRVGEPFEHLADDVGGRRDRQPCRLGEFREARRAIGIFEAIAFCRRRYGKRSIGPYIISMAEGVDDVLSVLLLAQWGELRKRSGTVPLDKARRLVRKFRDTYLIHLKPQERWRPRPGAKQPSAASMAKVPDPCISTHSASGPPLASRLSSLRIKRTRKGSGIPNAMKRSPAPRRGLSGPSGSRLLTAR